MNEIRPLGLYIHIPFCKSKCAYCDFYSLPRQGDERMDAYLDALCAQLRDMSQLAQDRTVDTIHFGGGTPSWFGAERLVRVLEAAVACYDVSADAEIALEANPDSARSVGALRTLRTSGFNRISIGVQTFDDPGLRALGRAHTALQAEQAVEAARRAGFENLSLDLMYGLPKQPKGRWLLNLASAVALAPEHLSCYALKLEPGTPLCERRDSLELPDDDAQADCYLEASAYLSEHGYEQYEISNFAKPGFESRHNLKYWTLGEYLGFGPGAYSDFDGQRFACASDLDGYLAGRIALSEAQPVKPRERMKEYVMLGLRIRRGIAADELPLPFEGAEEILLKCAQHGLAEKSDGRWRLTPDGFFVSNEIILRVLDALGL